VPFVETLERERDLDSIETELIFVEHPLLLIADRPCQLFDKAIASDGDSVFAELQSLVSKETSSNWRDDYLFSVAETSRTEHGGASSC
jgi:hypothetical protein